MNPVFLFSLASSLMLAPFAFAHTDGSPYGTPKTYCEDVKGDQKYHDYATATGIFMFLPQDGTISECPYAAGTEYPMHDGHFEFAQGGALLIAVDRPECGLPYADHPQFPTIWVFDHVLSQIPANVAFSVFSDTLNNVPPVNPNTPNCGDFESDFGVECVDHCTLGFPAGLDGTYQVFVNGFVGHIWTT